MHRPTPIFYLQFEAATQLDAAAFQVNGPTGVLAGTTVNVLEPGNALDWFSGEWLTTGAGPNFEQRSILKSTVGGAARSRR